MKCRRFKLPYIHLGSLQYLGFSLWVHGWELWSKQAFKGKAADPSPPARSPVPPPSCSRGSIAIWSTEPITHANPLQTSASRTSTDLVLVPPPQHLAGFREAQRIVQLIKDAIAAIACLACVAPVARTHRLRSMSLVPPRGLAGGKDYLSCRDKQ